MAFFVYLSYPQNIPIKGSLDMGVIVVLTLSVLLCTCGSFVGSLCLALQGDVCLLFGNDVFLFIKLMCFEGLT